MPVSDYHSISDVLHVVEQINPKSILDIGIGFGKYGVLLREVLDIYQGRYKPEEWFTTIDGVEIYNEYQNSLWSAVYNTVYIGNAFELIDSQKVYDLILVLDVIEHFDKETGKSFLYKLLKHGKYVIITSPRAFISNSAWKDNRFEKHRSVWSAEDFFKFPHLYKDISVCFMTILSANKENLSFIDMQHPLSQLGAEGQL